MPGCGRVVRGRANAADIVNSFNRCPVLRLDPAQRTRLIEIIANLRDRIAEARANGRQGEVEGLQVSMDAAAVKLASLKRPPVDGRARLVNLGMPGFADTPHGSQV